MSEEKNEQGQRRGLQRSLKARHMNMIAIGGRYWHRPLCSWW